jgi:hypothetical protein
MAKRRGSEHKVLPPKGSVAIEEKNIKKMRKEDGQWCENWNAMCVVTMSRVISSEVFTPKTILWIQTSLCRYLKVE